METRQNKPFVLSRGFKKNRSTQRQLFPKDSLTAFLNVNSKSKREIHEYCQNYNYLPSGQIKNLYRNFVREQKSVKRVAKKIAQSTISDSDISRINKALEKVHPQLTSISGREVSSFNKQLGGFDEKFSDKKKFYILSNVHASTYTSLWYEVAKRVENRDLKQCLNCGKFILVSKSAPHRKYCDDYCKDKYHKRKKRTKK